VAVRVRDAVQGAWSELRFEPTEKRVRVALGGRDVAVTERAALVWEPRRVVPSYAVPVDDLRADLRPAPAGPASDAAVLHPGIPFGVHSCAGDALSVRADGEERSGAAFRPADPDLAGYVMLDFDAFDWFEEDEPLFSHPRDPFHRVDVRHGSRHVRIGLGGAVLADSTRPTLVFETHLPVRFYLPRDDVRVPLHASPRRTACPYKGRAAYWSVDVAGRRVDDVAWSYETPLPDVAPLAGLVAFWDEQVDVTVDGERRGRPAGAAATALRDEFGL